MVKHLASVLDIFGSWSVFLTRLLMLSILLWTALGVLVGAKPVQYFIRISYQNH